MRKRSRKACVMCHQRKIKCDLDHQLDGSYCSNCIDLNVCCELYKRKTRVKKYQVHQNAEEGLSASKPTESLYEHVKLDPLKLLRNAYTDDNLIKKHQLVDVRHVLNTMLLQTSKTELNGAIDEGSGVASVKKHKLNSISDVDLAYLTNVGCFSLPPLDLCQTFVSAFFDKINPKFSIVDKEEFMNSFTDLTNPPSITLLQAILFVSSYLSLFGSKVLSSDSNLKVNGAASQINSQAMLLDNVYKKVKLLIDFNFEKSPFTVIQALSLISLPKHSTYGDKVWQYFKIVDYKSLNENNKVNYRKMFWWWKVRTSYHSLINNNITSSLSINSYIKIEPLNLHDYRFDDHFSHLEKLFVVRMLNISPVLHFINKKSLEADILASNNKPFDHITREIDETLLSWIANSDPRLIFKLNDESTQTKSAAFFTSIYYLIYMIIHIRNIARYKLLKSFEDKSTLEGLCYFPSWGVLILSSLMTYHIYNMFDISELAFSVGELYECVFFYHIAVLICLIIESNEAKNDPSWVYAHIFREMSVCIQKMAIHLLDFRIVNLDSRKRIQLIVKALQDEGARKILLQTASVSMEKVNYLPGDINMNHEYQECETTVKNEGVSITDLFQLNGIYFENSRKRTFKKMSISTFVEKSEVLIQNHLQTNADDLLTKIKTNWQPTFG